MYKLLYINYTSIILQKLLLINPGWLVLGFCLFVFPVTRSFKPELNIHTWYMGSIIYVYVIYIIGLTTLRLFSCRILHYLVDNANIVLPPPPVNKVALFSHYSFQVQFTWISRLVTLSPGSNMDLMRSISIAFQGVGCLLRQLVNIGLLIHISKLPFTVNVDSWFFTVCWQ